MSAIIFILVLSILVVVHEWGHYITARKLGVKVEKFSIGFGKKLWSWQRGDTEFMVSAIPLGGYVKMAGDERTQCSGNPEEFFSQSVWRRALIVVMGPLVNVLFAYVCLYALCVVGYPDIFATMEPRVAWVKAGSPADAAGVRVGDEIVQVGEKKIFVFEDVQEQVSDSGGSPVAFTFLRDGEFFQKHITPEAVTGEAAAEDEAQRWIIGIANQRLPAQIGAVLPGSPAQQAQLQKGDRIRAIDGRPVETFSQMQRMIQASAGRPLAFSIARGGDVVEATVTPEEEIEKGAEGPKSYWLIGVAPPTPPLERYGVVASFGVAVDQMYKLTRLTMVEFGKVLSGRKNAKQVFAGPIRIYGIVTGAAREGLTHLTFITAIISLNLAIINLFPIPVLDGGHLFFFALEGLRRRPLPLKVEDCLTRVGLGLLLGLFVFVAYNDILAMGWIDRLRQLLQHFGS